MTDPRPPRDDAARRRGILVVLSSPSGAGKTTLARRLMAEFPAVSFSVSTTTRPPRPGEREGRDYHFVDGAEFDRMIAAGAFAEWAHVHGNRYGTPRAAVEAALSGGRDVLFDVDWQGGKALGEQWPADALKVFVLPPSLELLERRLRDRATDSEEVIRRRLAKAVSELSHYREYDHLIVNDDLDRAYGTLRAIYLVRRYGERDRDGVPFPLETLASRVRANRESGVANHAEVLISRGRERGHMA